MLDLQLPQSPSVPGLVPMSLSSRYVLRSVLCLLSTLTGLCAAQSTSATTTTLMLCVGPSQTCPSNGLIVPPSVANLIMFYGQTFNGTAQAVANDGTTLTGSIAFNDDYNGVTGTLCTLPVNTSSACPPSVGTTQGTGVGMHIFTAVYSGDATHAPSVSPTVAINVSPDTTTATVAGAPNPAPQGQAVTFTATLTGNYAAPTGPVQFIQQFPPTTSALLLGTATLIPGSGLSSTATFTTSTLPVGVDTIVAGYTAAQNFGAAISPPYIETITQPVTGSFTLTATPNPVTAGVGIAAALNIKVTPLNGFAQGVNVSCSNLPSETTCTFLNGFIAPGAGGTTLFVTTTAPHSCNATQPYFLGSNGGGSGIAPLALPAIAGLLVTFLPGRRRWLRALVAILVAAAASQVTGCGNCTDLGTRPATYTFQVTGTATGTSEVESQAVTLNVTI
jgi:hypothetical protein